MKDFGQWMNAQRGKVPPTRNEHINILEEADVIRADGNGWWKVVCCRCLEQYELPCDVEEVDLDSEFYCGKDPYCCP